MAPTNVLEVVPGLNHRSEHVFSVIVKRTYQIVPGGPAERAEVDLPLRMIDQYYDDGDPEWSTVQYESELAPYKASTDVVVIGKAYAPRGVATEQLTVGVQVGERRKVLVVTGNRHCSYQPDAPPVFSDPEPFTEMEIRYDRAYGGRDEKSLPDLPFLYPRNYMGAGVVLRNVKEAVEGLPLPNIEDPTDLVSPERLFIEEPDRWHLQPLPQGFGWRQRTWYPRCALLGAYPAFLDPGTVTAEERMGLLPKDHIALAKQSRLRPMEAQFANGASLGMIFSSLKGDEPIVLGRLTADEVLKFTLPGDTPAIGLDLGQGMKQLESQLHTVSIRPDDREVDLIWRGALPYAGYRWASKNLTPAARGGPVSVPDTAATARELYATRAGEHTVLPGQSPSGEYILAVLVKRTYEIVPAGVCCRAEEDRALNAGDVYWDHPMNSSVRYESDFFPYKVATDVVLNGTAYAPGGSPTSSCIVSLQVDDRRKSIAVIGDRVARYAGGGTPDVTDPEPFTELQLRYELAYGGTDVYSDLKVPYFYPRNPLGRGFVVANSSKSIDNLPLPNLEDPTALISGEELCLVEYARWEDRPMPAGLGWFPKVWRPRALLVGVMPRDRVFEQELRRTYAQLVPEEHREAYMTNGFRDMDFRFFNGASEGLALPYLQGGETILTENLSPAGPLSFRLPTDTPRIGLDIGDGVQDPEVALHTVMIDMDEGLVDLVWRGAVVYRGPDWLPEMRTFELLIS